MSARGGRTCRADLGTTVRIGLEKDPAKRPPTATAYARMVQLAAGMIARHELTSGGRS